METARCRKLLSKAMVNHRVLLRFTDKMEKALRFGFYEGMCSERASPWPTLNHFLHFSAWMRTRGHPSGNLPEAFDNVPVLLFFSLSVAFESCHRMSFDVTIYK